MQEQNSSALEQDRPQAVCTNVPLMNLPEPIIQNSDSRMVSAPKGKHMRFIYDEKEEEAVNVKAGPSWLSKASASLPSKSTSCLISDADLLETAEAIDETVDMDEEAATNALNYWQHSLVEGDYRSVIFPTNSM